MPTIYELVTTDRCNYTSAHMLYSMYSGNMKTMSNTLSIALLLYLGILQQFSYSQTVDSTVSIELSIPHSDPLKTLNECSSFNNDVFVIIRNDTDSIVRFYENWNSYGYYNFTFEIKTKDSIYTISRPHKLWYRNFPSHHSVLPDESLVFQFDLIDSTCASSRTDHRVFEDGWIGFPQYSDTAQIRVVYSLPEEFLSYPDWASRKDDYLEYLNAENVNELNEIEPTTLREKNYSRIYIFSQTLTSEWRKVIISH